MAYPFMPMTTKTVREVSVAIEDSNLQSKKAKINGKFESEKLKQVLETNPCALKKIHSHRLTYNHY